MGNVDAKDDGDAVNEHDLPRVSLDRQGKAATRLACATRAAGRDPERRPPAVPGRSRAQHGPPVLAPPACAKKPLEMPLHSGGRDAVIRRIGLEQEAMAVSMDTILRLILEREIFA